MGIFGLKKCDDHVIFNMFGVKFKFFSPKLAFYIVISAINNLKVLLWEIINKNNSVYKLEPWESWMPENFYKDFITKDITEKYIKLIDGLDDSSIECVNNILVRIQRYAQTGQTYFKIPKEEAQIMEKMLYKRDNFVELSNGMYAFGKWVLPSNVYCASALYYEHNICDIKDKNKILNNDIIDAGAYIGDSALVLSKHTNGKIHSFEPSEANFQKMLKTIEANNLKNVIPVKMGLGSKKTEAMLNHLEHDFIFSYTKKNNNSGEKTYITTIDDYVKENNIKVGMIKTDVEGFEQDLLKGAIETIKRDKPILIISIYHTFSDFFDIKPMIESLNLGYKFKIRKPEWPDICCDIVLIAEVQ